MIDRRLSNGSQAPIAAAIASLLAATAVAQDRAPQWLMDARMAMQVRGTHGLAFVASAAGAFANRAEAAPRIAKVSARLHARIQERMKAAGKRPGMAMWGYGSNGEHELRAAAIQALLMSGDTAVRALLLDTVLICGTHAELGAKPGETIVLLDRFGRRVDGASVDLADEARVIATMKRLLLGERLRERAKQARPETMRAIAALTDRSKSAAARNTLLDDFDSASAAILAARENTEDARQRDALGAVIDRAFTDKFGVEGTERLPFGAEWIERHGDACPPCGMAVTPGPSRKFLSFLAR